MTAAGAFGFELEATSGRARAGRLQTPHGEVLTPCFMPVGTKATVKAVLPPALRALGAQVVLANTYHLYLRPGVELVRAHGGLHRFMGWPRSDPHRLGRLQVFSLSDTRVVGDDGVEFTSVYDGSRHLFTPRLAVAAQEALGADVVMCLDECAPGTLSRAEIERAVRAPRAGRPSAAPRRAATTSSWWASSRAAPMPPFAAARPPNCSPSTSAPTRSAASGRRTRRRDALHGEPHGRTSAGRPVPLLHGHR